MEDCFVSLASEINNFGPETRSVTETFKVISRICWNILVQTGYLDEINNYSMLINKTNMLF